MELLQWNHLAILLYANSKTKLNLKRKKRAFWYLKYVTLSIESRESQKYWRREKSHIKQNKDTDGRKKMPWKEQHSNNKN